MPSEVDSIREQLALLRAALASSEPAEIVDRLPAMQQAIDGLRRADPESFFRSDLDALQSELQRTAGLIRAGSDFWAGWARLLGMDTGYTPAGMAALPDEPVPHISEQG